MPTYPVVAFPGAAQSRAFTARLLELGMSTDAGTLHSFAVAARYMWQDCGTAYTQSRMSPMVVCDVDFVGYRGDHTLLILWESAMKLPMNLYWFCLYPCKRTGEPARSFFSNYHHVMRNVYLYAGTP